jgi:ATP-dependent helicase HepA
VSAPGWRPGDVLRHRHNPELGLGRVAAVEARQVVVEFPKGGTRLRLAAGSSALERVEIGPGARVRLVASGRFASVAGTADDGRLRLDDGSLAAVSELWPLELDAGLVERLCRGEVDPLADVALRLDALHLAALREADGLGSFLGGRIRLFPHQLHVAERATRSDPVRWLLADEVGLGKTVEACLILNRLVRSGRVERCLVVAPETLTVQWLGELWRKYHQVFVLLDEERLADVARDFGAGFNPFDAHRRAVVSLEALIARPRLAEQAREASIDLLVVDEAHHLRRPPGHPGNPAWRAVAGIAGLGRHLLLLSAIPFEDDAHGFLRLLQLLRPDDFPEHAPLDARLLRGEPLPTCTSSTRREDVGGFPPRVGVAVPAGDEAAWRERLALEQAVRQAPARLATERRQKSERVQRALASGAALLAAGPSETALRALAEKADASDPRLAWLAARAPGWKAAGEKTLVFVAHRETLDLVRTALSHRAQLASGVFHEGLSPGRRDIEVAQFRRAEGPSLLVSTECGGEGRNFEFCHRLVLFDLPWNPVVVEQRIGRLDRIGRSVPVEIVYFVPASGLGAEVVRLYEPLGLFREPIAGLEPQLARVYAALESAALSREGVLGEARADAILREAQAARTRIREAAYRELHRDRYLPGMAEGILKRVPPELDALNQDVVLAACERLGLHVERQRGSRVFSIELGNQALVESLPGVGGGASFLGSFDREHAVRDETLDYFASGHPLVEGVLAHLDESPLGRVGALRLATGAERGLGLLALYKDGPRFEALALDATGRPRPDWAAWLSKRPLRASRVAPELPRAPEWAATLRRLGAALDPARRPVALAGLVVGP